MPCLRCPVITNELCVPGKQSFEGMLSGKLIVLYSDTFSPCIHRIQKPMKHHELGFAPEGQAHRSELQPTRKQAPADM
jgi:hypothetical protein